MGLELMQGSRWEEQAWPSMSWLMELATTSRLSSSDVSMRYAAMLSSLYDQLSLQEMQTALIHFTFCMRRPNDRLAFQQICNRWAVLWRSRKFPYTENSTTTILHWEYRLKLPQTRMKRSHGSLGLFGITAYLRYSEIPWAIAVSSINLVDKVSPEASKIPNILLLSINCNCTAHK